MKPDFSMMNRRELRSYLLDHRDDREAFYAYIDRSEAEGNWIEGPAFDSTEDIDEFQTWFEAMLGKHKQADG